MRPRVREATEAGPSLRAKLCHLVLRSQQVQWCLKCLWQFGMPCVASSRPLAEHNIQSKLVIFGNKYSTVEKLLLAC